MRLPVSEWLIVILFSFAVLIFSLQRLQVVVCCATTAPVSAGLVKPHQINCTGSGSKLRPALNYGGYRVSLPGVPTPPATGRRPGKPVFFSNLLVTLTNPPAWLKNKFNLFFSYITPPGALA
jgi:hypothetical protein